MKLELVEYCNQDAPVVFEGKVYQVCVIDWDGDIVLKDDQLNGIKIINYTEVEKRMPDIRQISIGGNIQFGKTESLQQMINETIK